MALTFTERANLYSTSNAASYATSTTYTPAANSLLVVFVNQSNTDTTEVDPTGVTGHGVTFTMLSTTKFTSGVGTITCWAAYAGASPTSTAVTASFASARTGCEISEYEITGHDASGSAVAAIVATNIKTGNGTATSAALTMNAAGNAGNRCIGFFDHTATESIAADANNTLGSTGSYATPARGGGSVFNSTSYQNPGATWTTSAAWRGYAIEVSVATGATNQTVSPPAATANASAPIPNGGIRTTPAAATASASAPTPNGGIGTTPAAATASASSPLPTPQLRVSPAAATASASAPVPTVSGGAANQTVSPPAATASASAPTPGVGAGVNPAAASASASSPLPTPQLRLTPAAATASASALVPTVSTAPIVSPPAATASASSPTPTIQLRVSPPSATSSASSPLPVIQLRVTPPAATANATALSPTPQLRVTPASATAAASAIVPVVSSTGGGGANPPVTVRTILVGSSGRTRVLSPLSATEATGASGILALTGANGVTHATGTSGKTVV